MARKASKPKTPDNGIKSLEWLEKQKQHITLWQTPFVVALTKKTNGSMDDDTIRKYGKLWQALISAQWQLNNRSSYTINKDNMPLDWVWTWRLGRALEILKEGPTRETTRYFPELTREEMKQPAKPYLYNWIEKLLRMAFEFEDDVKDVESTPVMRTDDFTLEATLTPAEDGASSVSVTVSKGKQPEYLIVPALRAAKDEERKLRGFYTAQMTYEQVLEWFDYDPDRRYHLPAAALKYAAMEGVLYMPIQVTATLMQHWWDSNGANDDLKMYSRIVLEAAEWDTDSPEVMATVKAVNAAKTHLENSYGLLVLTREGKYEVLMGNAVMMAIAAAVKEKPDCKDYSVMVQFFGSDGLKTMRDAHEREGIRRAIKDFQEYNNIHES